MSVDTLKMCSRVWQMLLFIPEVFKAEWLQPVRDMCYGLKVCLLPKFLHWHLRHQCDGIWRRGHWKAIRSRLGHEGWSLLMRFLALKEERKRSPSLDHVSTLAICKPGREPSLEDQPCWQPDLICLANRTGRNKFPLFKPPSVCPLQYVIIVIPCRFIKSILSFLNPRSLKIIGYIRKINY